MKKYMMIIGAEILRSGTPGKQDDLMELTLIPLSTVKTKRDIASMFDLELITKQVQELQQPKDKIYIMSKEWVERKYKIAKHVTLELLPDDTTGGIK